MAQLDDVSDPALPQALAAEHADLDLRLIQPTSMLRRVVHRKTIPQPSAILLAKAVGQRLAGVGAQIVYDQMNGIGGRIVRGDLQDKIGKLRRRTRRRHFGEMNSCLRFNPAEDVSCSTALVRIVSPCHLTRLHGNHRRRIFMQNHRLLVDANDRFAF